MSELGIYYVIRHKATGQIMPQGKKNRGYSHWNPSNPEHTFEYALDFPRILSSRKRAHNCIIAWANNPNARRSFMTGDWGTEEVGVDISDDFRKKEDLEVVEVEIIERKL